MAEKHVIKLSAIMQFFQGEEKLIRRGENSIESGHVSNMVLEDSLKMLKGNVHASMRDRHYQVTISFTSDWEIEEGHCTCPRGLYRCHHMASLLLFGHYNISITDKSCAWVATKQSAAEDVKKVSDLYPPKPHRSTSRDLSVDEVQQLVEKLSLFEGAVGFTWLLSKEEPVVGKPLIPDIEEVIFSKEYLDSADKLTYFLNSTEVSQETITLVAEDTIGQQKNRKWLVAKRHRLTASNFGVVLSACRRKRYVASLFKRLTGAYNLDHIKAIQWGRENEKLAVKALEDALNTKVLPTGLWLDKCGFLGASPDGLVGDHAIVEVKCPFKYREQSLMEGIRRNHDYILIADNDNVVSVNKKHEYFAQIQGQLAITKRNVCYLCVWTPKEVVIVEIEKEDFEQEYLILKTFYTDHYLKFLIGEKYANLQ